jgi:hypothetical protein
LEPNPQSGQPLGCYRERSFNIQGRQPPVFVPRQIPREVLDAWER